MRRATVLLLLCLAPRAFGQSHYATVSGAVSDPQRSPVAGAAVVLASRETHAERRVATNSEGIFQITGILPGDYDLSVTASRFAEPSLRLLERMKFQFRAELLQRLEPGQSRHPGPLP